MKNNKVIACLLMYLGLSAFLVASITGTKRLKHQNGAYYLERDSLSNWAVVKNYSLNATAGGNCWVITAINSTYYKIENGTFALSKGDNGEWKSVKAYTFNSWSGQQWKIESVGNNQYKIINKSNGLALTGNGSFAGEVKLATYNGWSTQRWNLHNVDTSSWPSGTFERIFDGITRTYNMNPAHDDTLIINCNLSSMTHRPMDINGRDNIYVKQTTIDNFTSDYGVLIRNSTNVIIDDCIVSNQTRPAGAHSAGIRAEASDAVVIKNNTIAYVDGNGIYNETVTGNLLMDNNEIYDVGLFPYSSSAPFHGIYSKSQDAQITNNLIYNSMDGQGISMRTTGVISGNTVYDCKHACIAYWPMVPPGASNRLDILNNDVWQNDYDTDYSWPAAACIGVYDSGNKPAGNYFDNFLIQGNTCTVYSASSSDEAIVSMTKILPYGYGNVDVINNILNDHRSTENHLDSEHHMDEITGNTLN